MEGVALSMGDGSRLEQSHPHAEELPGRIDASYLKLFFRLLHEAKNLLRCWLQIESEAVVDNWPVCRHRFACSNSRRRLRGRTLRRTSSMALFQKRGIYFRPYSALLSSRLSCIIGCWKSFSALEARRRTHQWKSVTSAVWAPSMAVIAASERRETS